MFLLKLEGWWARRWTTGSPRGQHLMPFFSLLTRLSIALRLLKFSKNTKCMLHSGWPRPALIPPNVESSRSLWLYTSTVFDVRAMYRH